MTDSDETVLRGLPGDNPLGFLAALGVQIALDAQGHDHRMRWSDEPIPYPVLSPSADLVLIAAAARAVAARWLEGPALDQAVEPKLKLRPQEIRQYLERCRNVGASGSIASCLVAEGSLDNGGKAKPTDLYFTAGQQRFVSAARTILGDVTDDEIVGDIGTPWRYESQRESLMWDSVDDRLHAYSASDPTKSQKSTNPGAEALAVLGLSMYPCFASPNGTLTQGCSGGWKRGEFVWPLWTVSATVGAVRSLLAQVAVPDMSVERQGSRRRRSDWYRSWGLSRVMQSQIRRSDQGGSGTFGPPLVVWQRD